MIWCLLIMAAGLVVLFPVFGCTNLHIHRKAKGNRIRVACVGDSITNGAQIPNCFANSYPAVLQRLLGKACHVENFGLNDRTAQSTGDKPYSAEKEYRLSIRFQPDIVIVLLGTNDTKPINWRSRECFAAEYRSLLHTWLDLEKKPQVILCTPPWAKEMGTLAERLTGDTDTSALREAADAVRRIGREYKLPVVDLYAAFEGKRELLGFDRLHPNIRGAGVIAHEVYREITGSALTGRGGQQMQ